MERWMEKLRQFAISLRIQDGAGYAVDRSMDGQRIVLAPRASTPVQGFTTTRMVIRSIMPDYLVCRKFSDLSEGAVVNVAKPVWLRQTTWNNQTIIGGMSTKRYVASGDNGRIAYVFEDATGSLSINEEVQPKYATEGLQITSTPPVLSVIYAMAPSDGTGITGVSLIDMNIDARNFISDVTQFHLCIGNRLYRAAFHAGAAVEIET